VYRDERGQTALNVHRLKAQEPHLEAQRQRARLRFAGNVRLLWGERTFLVRISVLGLILGLLAAFLLPARYTATTRLMPPDNQAGSALAVTAAALGVTRGVGELAGDLLGVKSNSEVFAEILLSRTLQDRIIEKFDLKRVYGVSTMTDARARLSRKVGIGVDRKTQMITISVADRNPQRAAEMATAYTEELNRLVSELSTSSAHRERVFLEARLVQVNQDLENAEQEFSRFASKSGAIDVKEQSKTMLEVAGTLQGQLISAQTELEGLRQIYSDSHVRVRTQKARVAELQEQLSKIGGLGQGGVAGPETSAADLYPSIRKLPLLGVTYADLYRRTRVEETLYEVLTQEHELAKVEEARETPSVKVLDAPEVPEKKDFPPRRLIATSSTAIAFFSGIIILLANKSWEDRDPDDWGKTLAKEIWIDLKEKRFLNPVAQPAPEPHLPGSIQLKRGLFFLLGWNKGLRESDGPSITSAHDASDKGFDRNRSQTTNPPEEEGLRGTA